MENELLIDSVNISFGNKKILTDIYLKIHTGDIIGLLGRNGCGKSTLLKIIFGTLEAENKFIRANGRVYDKLYKQNEIINMLPQDDFLPKGFKVKHIAKLYKNINFEEFKLVQKIYNTKIEDLSGGEIRYFEFILLINSNAKFLLLDEPFNGVSPILADEIKIMIKNNSCNKGIIITDHDYRNVLSVANQIYIMKNGAIKKVNSEEELVNYGYIQSIC